MIYKYRSTGNASDRGRCVPPPPRQPLPHGGDIPSTHCRGRDNLSTVSVNTLPESCSCSPATAIGPIATHCPPPSEGGGRRPRSGREVGVACLTWKRSVWLRCRRQGKGRSAPSPSAPPPRGRYPIDALPGKRQPLYRQCEHPTGIPFLLPWHGHRANHPSLPAPSEGGGRRRWKRRVVGVIQRERFSVARERQGKVRSAPPRQPLPHGGDSP